MVLEEFEKLVGKSVKDFTMEDVTFISKNDDCVKLLSENTFEIVNAVIEQNEDLDVINQFLPIKYHELFYNGERDTAKLYKKYEENNVDRTDLINDVKDNIENASTYLLLPLIFTALLSISKEELDLSVYKNKIQAAITDLVDVIEVLAIDCAYMMICDMLDLIYEIREEYYKIYSEDIISENDAARLSNRISELSAFNEQFVNQEIDEYQKAIGEDSTPEDFGYIDITKLRKDDEDAEAK